MGWLLHIWPALGLLPPSNYHGFFFSFFFSFFSFSVPWACTVHAQVLHTPLSLDTLYNEEIKSQQCSRPISSIRSSPEVFPSREKARSHWNWQRHRCLPFTGHSLTYMRHWESTTESRNQLLSGCPMSPHLSEPRASSPTSNLPLFFLSPLLSPASILLYNLEFVPLPLQLRTSQGLHSVLSTAASPAPGRVGSQ